ncbi:MAG TPA: helix-turn-helix domain-containing protein [Nocardioides sp.]|nr:helix-turn-helix domain-containing protein [Nocardioides sp.]
MRAEQARLTERRITDAAHKLFLAQGYGQTTLAAVAREAGVSTQTIYNVFGTKPALLKKVHDLVLIGDDEPIPLAQRPEVQAMYADEDPARFLRAYAALGRTIAERVGPLIVLAQAGALGGDAELAAHVEIVEGEHLFGTTMAAKRVDELGALRSGLTVEGARDRIWTLTSPSVWHLLVRKRGWSGDEYAEWVGDALCDAVLAR